MPRRTREDRQAARAAVRARAATPHTWLGFSPDAVPAKTVVESQIVAARPMRLLQLYVNESCAEHFDFVDLQVADVAMFQADNGITARAFLLDVSPQIFPSQVVQVGESVVLKLRNRTNEPRDFRGFILAEIVNERPKKTHTVHPALPGLRGRVR